MRKIYPLIISASLIFGGCAAGTYDKVSDFAYNKDKGYVNFVRPSNQGEMYSHSIVEFNPETFELDFIGVLADDSTLKYESSPGRRYFYMGPPETSSGAIPALFVANLAISVPGAIMMATAASILNGQVGYIYTVDIDANKDYYIVLFLAGANFTKITNKAFELTNEIKGKKCTEDLISQYNLNLHSTLRDNPVVPSNFDVYSIPFSANLKVECTNDYVSDVKYDGQNIDRLKNIDIIKPNESGYQHFEKNKEIYRANIKNIYELFTKLSEEDLAKYTLNSSDGVDIKN